MKSVLKAEYRDKLLNNDDAVYRLSKQFGRGFEAMKALIRRDSEKLMLPHNLILIQDALGVGSGEQIFETTTEETHLHE